MAPETRRAAKKRRLAQLPLLHELPPLDRILGFLDIPSLILTAGCNTALRNAVYNTENNEELIWSKGTIDFGLVPRATAARITDNQLQALLQNCHARNKCRVLKLRGCTRIRGMGLEPLRGSCVLREADLRLDPSNEPGPVELDMNFVLPLLSSMPPFVNPERPLPENSLGLALVKFRWQDNEENFFDRFDENVSDWFGQFLERLRTQAIARRTRCGYCREVISEGENFEEWTMGANYCEQCTRYTCGGECTASCPMTNDCEICLIQCCQPFGPEMKRQCLAHRMVYDCENCGHSKCQDCATAVMCGNVENCGNSYCENCVRFLCRECVKGCGTGVYCPDCIGLHETACRADVSSND